MLFFAWSFPHVYYFFFLFQLMDLIVCYFHSIIFVRDQMWNYVDSLQRERQQHQNSKMQYHGEIVSPVDQEYS